MPVVVKSSKKIAETLEQFLETVTYFGGRGRVNHFNVIDYVNTVGRTVTVKNPNFPDDFDRDSVIQEFKQLIGKIPGFNPFDGKDHNLADLEEHLGSEERARQFMAVAKVLKLVDLQIDNRGPVNSFHPAGYYPRIRKL